MHDKYGKDGLEVLSVILDEPKDTGGKNFLAKKLRPKFRSVQIDPNAFDYEKKVNPANNFPAVFVFNRDNLWVTRMPVIDDKGDAQEVDYDLIEKTVADLVKK